MDGRAFLLMLLSGLWSLPSCFTRQYHFVEVNKTWTEAQSYCRQKYTDLATVTSEEDVAKMIHAVGLQHRHVWIGLHGDPSSWSWSLQDQSYYGEGQADFRNWTSSSPNKESTGYHCVMISSDRLWWDEACDQKHPYICYSAQGSPRFIYVKEKVTWTEAQSLCRQNHTDLASVRNQTENQEIRKLLNANSVSWVWIGLRRGAWNWSDGSAVSFTKWETENNEPIAESCVAANPGRWETWPCSQRFYFACYSGDAATMQVVRLRLTKTDSSADLEDMKEALLQQLHQRLKDQGLSGDIQLRWVTQPDGKVFHLEEREDEEEKSCSAN